MSTRVIFRVDASIAIGTGHVMRCLTLADLIVADGGACSFVMRRLEGNLIDFVASRGHRVDPLPKPTGATRASADDRHSEWLEVEPMTDAEQTRAAIAVLGGADWLVVDHYALDARWEQALRPAARRIAVIDDLADRPHDADLLIDQNLNMDDRRYDGLTNADCVRLLGPRFALLRPEFSSYRAKLARDPKTPVRRVLVFIGGVDAPGATLTALAALEAARDGPIVADVVVGTANPRVDAIEAWCSTRSWATLHVGNAPLADLMVAADLAIGAGGTTVWERCALAMPSVVVSIAANQLAGASAVAGYGAALYAGPAADCDAGLRSMIGTMLVSSDLRAHVSERAASLVDGKGTGRVLAHLKSEPIAIRRAEASDMRLTHEWRNTERTRRYFRDPQPVALADHQRWFDTTLAAQDRDLLIGESAGEPIGVLRFDHHDDRAEVSIYLAPERTGRGLGGQLLRAGMGWISRARPATRTIEADVLADNIASHRAFVAAGFEPFATAYRHTMARGTSI